MTRSAQVAGQPLGVAAVDVTSIGAGGGIGWIDPGGALRVAPASAGAVPGPACYGQGGLAPTVTDAHVVLGTLAPDAFLAGRRALDRGRAVAAIRANLAAPLGTTSEVAAAGIINVLEANMVAAIREISVGRGIAPAVRPGRRRWCWRPARHLHVLPHAYQIELAGKAETGM